MLESSLSLPRGTSASDSAERDSFLNSVGGGGSMTTSGLSMRGGGDGGLSSKVAATLGEVGDKAKHLFKDAVSGVADLITRNKDDESKYETRTEIFGTGSFSIKTTVQKGQKK